MSAKRNFIAFACGMRSSGKSYLLGKFAERFPRRLIFDFTDEHADALPSGALVGRGLAGTVDALRRAARSGPRWTVVATLYEEDSPELVSALIPTFDGGADSAGFSKAVGGMVVECGEIDLLAPNNASISRPVRNMFQRGRHHGLSVLAATQRPRDVHRVVTSQSDVIAAFRQHEPRDVDYLDSVMRGRASRLLESLKPQWHLRYYPNYGELQLVDPAGSATAVRD